MNLHLMLLLSGGVILLAVILDVVRRRKTQRALVQPTLGDMDVLSEDITESFFSPKNFSATPKRGENFKHIEPILGDSKLASMGLEEEVLWQPPIITKPVAVKSEESILPKTSFVAPKSVTVLIIYVMAPKGKAFLGYELLQTLLAAEMRFGKMNIFHRYVTSEDEDNILFSLTSAIEPGIFDISAMGGFSTPGLCLFMKVKNPGNSLQAFDLMIETARQLADELGGDLYDENHNVFTEESAREYQVKISLS